MKLLNWKKLEKLKMKLNKSHIIFDLDGTLYNLYGIDNWLKKVESGDPSVFTEGETLVNTEALNKKIEVFKKMGCTFSVVTWLPMGATDKYKKECYSRKMNWCRENLPTISEVNIIDYGIGKHLYRKKDKFNYLIDDNLEINDKFNKINNCKGMGLNLFLGKSVK